MKKIKTLTIKQLKEILDMYPDYAPIYFGVNLKPIFGVAMSLRKKQNKVYIN